MVGTYDGWLVLLSVTVAIMASFVALNLVSRVTASQGRRREWYWLAGGAVTIGIGIWSMHFIGMLAFHLPIAISFDVVITLLSLGLPIAVSGLGLHVASRRTLSRTGLLWGGALMGIGVVSMHYTGMAAMRMTPPIQYDLVLFGLSVVIAVAAWVIALWGAFTLRLNTLASAFWKKAGGALIMGAAIYGMHLTGMEASIFAPDGVCIVSPQNINPTGLAVTLGAFTLLFLTATLLVAAFDAQLLERSVEHAKALRHAHDMLEQRVSVRTAELTRSTLSLQTQIAVRNRAADELRQAQARTKSVLNSMSDIYILFDRQWRYLDVNEAAVRAIDRPREQILGRTLWEIYPDIAGTELERQYRRTMDERVPVAFDFHYVTFDIWWGNRVFPVSEGLAVFATEITERKAAEVARRRSEEQFLKIFRMSPVAICIATVHEGRIIDVNERFVEFCGYGRTELIGTTGFELRMWIDAEQRAQLVKKLLAGEAVHNVEAQFRRKSGDIATALYSRELLELGEQPVSFAMCVDITERKAAETKLAEYADQLLALSHRLAELQETERRQLSRELHDRVGQYLTALNLNLDIIRNQLGTAYLDRVAARIEDSASLVEATMDAVNNLMSRLRPPMLDDSGLFEALKWHAGEFTKRTSIATTVTASGAMLEIPQDVQLTLFRIAQEALTNIAKHAHARTVRLELNVERDKTWLNIIDDGIGFEPAALLNGPNRPHWGLLSMRERVQAVGGVLRVDSAPGCGTGVTAEVQRPV